MKSILKHLIFLYPRAWRDRYESEFLALLDDVPPTWRTLVDVFGGALKMQMKIWSPLKIVAAFAIVGALAATVFSLTVPDRYVSTAIIKIDNLRPGGLVAILHRVESRSSLAHLINEQDLYKRERSREPLEDLIERMKTKDIRIASIESKNGGTPAISISFAATDANQARQTTSSLVSEFIDDSIRNHGDNPADQGQTLSLLDPASVAVQVGPRRSRSIFMGAIAGVLAGALFALFNGLKIWKLAALMGSAGCVLAAVVSYAIPDRFSSSAVLACTGADQSQVRQMIGSVTSSDSIHAIVSQLGLYPNDARADRKASEHLHVSQMAVDGRVILIQFDYPDQRVAQRVTQSVVARLIKENWNFEILDPATSPPDPIFPNRAVIAGMGLCLGLAAAVLLRVTKKSLPVVAALG